MYNKKLTLSNGVEISQLGLGTQFIDDDKVADAVKAAADLGYRHFDTAQAYGNERGVGEGIRTCGIPREELFVVSKVAAEHKTYEDAKASLFTPQSLMARFYTSRRLPLWLKNTEYLFHSFASVIHCSSVRFHFLKPVIRNI